MRYEVSSHTADVGIVAFGASREELFENAAFGMFDLMFDLSSLEPDTDSQLAVSGEDPAELLYRWLSELLFRFEVDETVWCRFDVSFAAEGLNARVQGTGTSGVELRGAPIKAVTFHGLQIEGYARGWAATVLFDA